MVRSLLCAAHIPIWRSSLLRLSTRRGDEVLTARLGHIASKGLFIKDWRWPWGRPRADLAVHSYKDVSVKCKLSPVYRLARISRALEDPRDSACSSVLFGSLRATAAGSRAWAPIGS